MGTNPPAYGSIEPVVNETGHVSLSVDGLAENTGSGTIRVNKPAGAAVRKAFMAAASSGYSGYQIPNGGVTIDGQAVTWEMATPSSILSWNHWADVTSLVKSKIDTAPAGIVTFTVGEQNTDSIDGEILAVIFDDPNQTTNNTVALLFGAQNVAGDSFHIRFADPIDTSDPNLKLDMSLGISFGYQNSVEATGQYSIVNVNGQRLSTSAGGQDDCNQSTLDSCFRGTLLTVGGIGDSDANPPNPFATPGGARSDDELYSLVPFVKSGDTDATVFTQNPSQDDNIFFSAFYLQNVSAIVGDGIVLGPAAQTLHVGGTSTPASVNGISVYSAAFQGAIVAGDVNVVSSGRVIPVRIWIGCGNAGLTGLQPTIRLLQGDQDGMTDTGTSTVPLTSSAAQTTGIMSDMGGGYYQYNAQVPTESSQYWTFRVRPFGESNTSASMYAAIKTK